MSGQAAALMVLWVLLSGHYDVFHIGLGVLSVVLVIAMNRYRAPLLKDSPESVPRWSRVILYIPWLTVEMIKSALYVAKIVLSPSMPISPCLIRFKSEQPNEIAKVILGNSITLTPGTLTIDIGEQEFLVHALTETTAQGLLNETMQTKVARLFTDEPKNMVFDARRVPSTKRGE